MSLKVNLRTRNGGLPIEVDTKLKSYVPNMR